MVRRDREHERVVVGHDTIFSDLLAAALEGEPGFHVCRQGLAAKPGLSLWLTAHGGPGPLGMFVLATVAGGPPARSWPAYSASFVSSC
jgi:hypothetical protein